ncbi:reverse transcriptase [Trichonephila clavipes]|nr:reverse transcriptase [Trichonephila clavipes]
MTQKTQSLVNPCEASAPVGPIPRHLERTEDLSSFCLTTGHDFFRVYLHWPGLATNKAYPLCTHARMDGDHLLQCTGLNEFPTEVLGGSTSNIQEVKHGDG